MRGSNANPQRHAERSTHGDEEATSSSSVVASSISSPGAASPMKPEIGSVVPDTQMMPQIAQESTRGRPVTGEVELAGRCSPQLRAPLRNWELLSTYARHRVFLTTKIIRRHWLLQVQRVDRTARASRRTKRRGACANRLHGRRRRSETSSIQRQA